MILPSSGQLVILDISLTMTDTGLTGAAAQRLLIIYGQSQY